jgi:hypothetical protein
MATNGEIELLDDISIYTGLPRKPKEQIRPPPDQMMISMPPVDPSPQEISKVGFTMPAYYQPELFSGPLEYPPQYPYQLPPPSNTSNLNTLPPINHILDMNCRDVDTHLKGCPVCGQLHKSNAYVYIGIIVFLILICFFLGRKFFD